MDHPGALVGQCLRIAVRRDGAGKTMSQPDRAVSALLEETCASLVENFPESRRIGIFVFHVHRAGIVREAFRDPLIAIAAPPNLVAEPLMRQLVRPCQLGDQKLRFGL